MDTENVYAFNMNPDELQRYLNQINNYEKQIREIEFKSNGKQQNNDNPEWILVLMTGIAGINHHVHIETDEGKLLMSKLIPGVELKLVREPDNAYDRWAVALFYEERKIGYLTRFKNETIARLMDSGFIFKAVIEGLSIAELKVLVRNRADTEDYILPLSVWMNKTQEKRNQEDNDNQGKSI